MEGGGDDERETGAVWMLATRAAEEIGRSSTARAGSPIFMEAFTAVIKVVNYL